MHLESLGELGEVAGGDGEGRGWQREETEQKTGLLECLKNKHD